MDCGTHITGKYKGITGTEPFACVKVSTPAATGKVKIRSTWPKGTK